MRYFSSLDGLRFFAVFLVIIHHWLPKNHILNFLPNGGIGVTIFFVLSGYLISNILFNYRKKVESSEITLSKALSIFYIRRTLRIFPVYYLLIFFLLIYGYSSIRENFMFFIGYASNVLFFLEKSMAGTVSHLWTLAVEEQFYLFWPFIILLSPRKYLIHIIISFVLFSILVQLAWGREDSYFNLLTFTTFDSFGLGALLAYLQNHQRESLSNAKRITFILFLLAILAHFSEFFLSTPMIFTARTTTSFFSVWLIGIITREGSENGILQKFLSFSAFVYIGKISYGVYLFHTFIPGLMKNKYELFGISSDLIIFISNLSITILIASMSWFTFESPINNLKKRFQITPKVKTI